MDKLLIRVLHTRWGVLAQLIGGLLLLLLMPFIELLSLEKNFNNCWFYAMDMWVKHGGYVMAEDSKYGWWAHYYHSYDGITATCFTTDTKYIRLISPLIFRGYIKTWTLPIPLNLVISQTII